MWGLGGRLVRRDYAVTSRLWRAPAIRIALLTDLHICRPWTPPGALDALIAEVQAAEPDLILLAGDFLSRNVIPSRFVPIETIAAHLAPLRAPLGVFACLGNHDWRDCPIARGNGFAETGVTSALEAAGIPVLANRALPLEGSIWLIGLDSQQGSGGLGRPDPRHDPDLAFADVPDAASILLMAHEPDIFVELDRPVALQVSGHTHGGQINLFGWRPFTPSRYGGRLAHGLHAEGERHLLVSAGVGYTGPPVRIGAPPEWVMVEMSSA